MFEGNVEVHATLCICYLCVCVFCVFTFEMLCTAKEVRCESTEELRRSSKSLATIILMGGFKVSFQD